MNSKILGMVVTIIAVAMLASPVMATPKDSSPSWYTISATDSYVEKTYADLNQLCEEAGLSTNPYPAPTTPNDYFVGPIEHIEGATVYYLCTITIGDKSYPAVACNIYDLTINWLTGHFDYAYQSVHYLGAIGEMNHGFAGIATADLQLYGPGPNDYYFTANWDLKGFGHFTGQSLALSQDTRISDIATGYCTVLGNRYH
jgi:hypothetical protein